MYIMLTSIKQYKRCIMSKRIFYLDVIKVLAMFMVVFNHCHLFINNSSNFIFIIHYLLFFISKTAVPLFFMISGALLIKKNDPPKKIIKRIIRIIIPLITITILWRLFDTYIHSYNNDFWPYWLWYLLALIVIYICLPFINKHISNIKNPNYKRFFLILLIIPSILFSINIFYHIYIGKYIHNNLFFSIFPLPIAYFVLGFFLKNKKITKKMKNISIFTFLITLATVTSLAFILYKNDISFIQLDSYKTIFTMLMSPALFIIIKYLFENYNKNNEFYSLILNLGNNSFAIYLFHIFIIELLYKNIFFKELLSFNSFEAVLVIQTFTIILLDIIFTILKHIPILKNVLNRYFS